MINVNLLPDIKMERIKNARKQRLIASLSLLAIGVGIALPVFLMILWGGQKALLAITQNSIERKIKDLKSIEDLDNILTVQNQLKALPDLEQRRMYYTTMLNLLPQFLPQNASLTSLDISDAGSVSVLGDADSLSTVNDFINILSRAELKKGDQVLPAFTGVTLVRGSPSDEGAAFEVAFSYDQVLVDKLLDYELWVADQLLYKPPETDSSEGTETSEPSTTNEDESLFGDEPTQSEVNDGN